eukprot:gene13744-biopygen5050
MRPPGATNGMRHVPASRPPNSGVTGAPRPSLVSGVGRSWCQGCAAAGVRGAPQLVSGVRRSWCQGCAAAGVRGAPQ